jgi:hypothetical protein
MAIDIVNKALDYGVLIGTCRTKLMLEIDELYTPKGGLSKQSNDTNS